MVLVEVDVLPGGDAQRGQTGFRGGAGGGGECSLRFPFPPHYNMKLPELP